ncbi:MAG: DUF3710 domain-containing protein [Nocardioidaceae bacterium]|nr:DUF3710 domain-containing protein [Nocardioidaceae bacterium]MCL2611819.1 DUF3710 domain-containing protein [Nocardioidaceae bacterium]
MTSDEAVTEQDTETTEQGGTVEATGPYDVDELPDADIERVDLGSLLIAPFSGRDLRVHYDEESGEVRGVQLVDEQGDVDLRAFAAPRGGDLWGEIRPQIAAEASRLGGNATEREGRFGTELLCEVPATLPDGGQVVQLRRIVGVNGPRWLLRATFTGAPAEDEAVAAVWDDALAQVAVRRGGHAMPVGEQLDLRLPDGAVRQEGGHG